MGVGSILLVHRLRGHVLPATALAVTWIGSCGGHRTDRILELSPLTRPPARMCFPPISQSQSTHGSSRPSVATRGGQDPRGMNTVPHMGQTKEGEKSKGGARGLIQPMPPRIASDRSVVAWHGAHWQQQSSGAVVLVRHHCTGATADRGLGVAARGHH